MPSARPCPLPILAALALAPAPAPAAAPEPSTQSRVVYQCEPAGSLDVLFTQAPDQARVRIPGRDDLVLRRTPEPGPGYSDGRNELAVQGREARWTMGRYAPLACRATRAPEGPAIQAPDAALIGTRWDLLELDGAAAGQGLSPRGAHLTLGPGDRVEAHGGCNRLRGRFTQGGEALGLQVTATTRAACPEPAQAREQALLAALAATARARIAGQTLELIDASGRVRARLEARYRR